MSCASKELELEQRLRGTEEEWGEQVGVILYSNSFTSIFELTS